MKDGEGSHSAPETQPQPRRREASAVCRVRKSRRVCLPRRRSGKSSTSTCAEQQHSSGPVETAQGGRIVDYFEIEDDIYFKIAHPGESKRSHVMSFSALEREKPQMLLSFFRQHLKDKLSA